MPAKLPKATQNKIKKLHLAGKTYVEIAEELGVSRHTAKRYAGDVPKELLLKYSLDAQIDTRLLAVLQGMLRQVTCPHCSKRITILCTQPQVRCSHCLRVFSMKVRD
jgi:orotate phosphoribosyltransferase-like protein